MGKFRRKNEVHPGIQGPLRLLSTVVSARARLVYLIAFAVATQIFFTGYLHVKIRVEEDAQQIQEMKKEEKVIVVYTGPTSLDSEQGKNWLYLKNFEYFLKHGIDCIAQDTILVLTPPVAEHYAETIRGLRSECDTHRHWKIEGDDNHIIDTKSTSVRVVERHDRCYDMEGIHMVIENIELDHYHFLVHLNCGIVGPKLPELEYGVTGEYLDRSPWTHHYTSLLSERIKMSGLSINCEIHPHIQSMLFAVDKVGLQILRKSGAIYNCGLPNSEFTKETRSDLIVRYEIGMSKAILEAGYSIRSTHGHNGPTEIGPHDIGGDLSWCQHDPWYPTKLPITPATKWEDFVFFKASRMFLLPGMHEEIQYRRKNAFEILDLIPIERKSVDVDTSLNSLWEGGDSSMRMMESDSWEASVVVSHCRGSLFWLKGYLSNWRFKSVAVVSKCGVEPDPHDLPDGTELFTLPNVGRVDHTMAYWMAEVVPKRYNNMNDVLVFLKDNLYRQPENRRRGISELLGVSSTYGFACLEKPPYPTSHFHHTETLKIFNMTHYDGINSYHRNGSRVVTNSNKAFKSNYINFGEWLSNIGIALPTPYSPVCYGGSYAVTASQILATPPKILEKLKASLSRDDNIEEGHFAERTWAALFSPGLTRAQVGYLSSKARHIYEFVGHDGGGRLGALMESALPRPPNARLPQDNKSMEWFVKDGRWQWPESYNPHVTDPDNVCIRPLVEPNIPKESHTSRKPQTVAMCTVVDDDLRYINEWIDFNLALGFAHFYLYDTHDTPRVERYLHATRQGWSKYISVIHWPGQNHERTVWTHCFTVDARAANHTWAANFDTDDFLVLSRHEHVVALLDSFCPSGSVHLDSYMFAPNALPDQHRSRLSSVMLNEQETYELSAYRSAHGLSRPLLHRNRYCGQLGWDGTRISKQYYRVKSIASISDVKAFNTDLPELLPSGERKTLRNHVVSTERIPKKISGSDVASIFRYEYKSVPEFIYKKCRGGNVTTSADMKKCKTSRTVATKAGVWISFRKFNNDTAWEFLRARIPWYAHFDENIKGVECSNREEFLG